MILIINTGYQKKYLVGFRLIVTRRCSALTIAEARVLVASVALIIAFNKDKADPIAKMSLIVHYT